MKANVDRGGRLAFDAVADSYERARPAVPDPLVEEVRQVAGLVPGDPVLEIGAGTGQLTLPLRRAGLRVVALEPGRLLRTRLQALTKDDPGVLVHAGLFEDYPGEQASFAAVAAANAFHWIDPRIGYEKAARLLRPGGHLVLIWNFPIAGRGVQATLNEHVFAASYPDFVRDPGSFLAGVSRDAADGRDELLASNHFVSPWWRFTTDTFVLGLSDYLELLTSYANVAVLDQAGQTELRTRVRHALTVSGVHEVEIVNHIYVCVSRREER